MSHDDEDTQLASSERVAGFLRALADRAGRDKRFATTLAECLAESGLLAVGMDAPLSQRPIARARRRPGVSGEDARTSTLDPFALWRAQGESALRAALAEMDLSQLKAVVRASRLDPARVSSRWTARERIAALIVEQVKARLNHGRAFERV